MPAARQVRDFGKPQRSEIPGNGEHAQQKARVADAVHNERFIGCGAGGMAMEIESDQQIRTQPHALPAHKHQHIIVRQNQSQHGEHEQIEVSEKTVIPVFMRHVPGRVNMNESADAGHKQKPDAGQWVEQKADVGLKRCRPSRRA